MNSKEAVNHFTVKGVADYCLVSKVTVRRWIKSAKLSAIRLPSGHYRISSADFRDFLKRYDMPVEGVLLGPSLKRKEVNNNGSTNLDGVLGTG